MQSLNWGDLARQAENAGGGEPVPISEYPVIVAACEAKQSTTGKPMLKVRAKIQGGPYDGKTLFTQMTLSVENDNAVAIFMRHLGAFGITPADLASNPNFEVLATWLVNRTAIFDVGQKTYQGELRNEVKNIKPLSAVPGFAPASAPSAPTPTVPVPTMSPVPQAPAPVPVAPSPVAPPAPAPVPTPAPAPPAPAPAIPLPAPAPEPVPAPAAPAPVQDTSTPAPPAPPF